MLYLQSRIVAPYDWRNVYIIDAGAASLAGQRRQAIEVNSHYPEPQVRIVETLGSEIVRVVPLDAADEPSDEEIRALRIDAANRAAARYQKVGA